MKGFEERSEELKSKAISYGLCDKYVNEWSDGLNSDELLKRYKDGIHFCIRNDYPTLDYMRTHFSKEETEKHHVYIDGKASLTNADDVVVLNGKSEVKYIASGNSIVHIYVRHNSTLHLGAGDFALVMVHLYDDGKVIAAQMGKSKVSVLKYSKNSEVLKVGDIRIIYKEIEK